MANSYSVDVSLTGKNAARLAMREYKKAYTNVPNSALPKSLSETLNTIYEFFTGESLPPEDYTFLVRAENGKFRRVFSPAAYSNPDGSGFLIRWGERDIPLLIQDGKVTASNKAKHSVKVKIQSINGYDTVVLALSFADKEKNIYSMPFPLRPASYEDGIDDNELEMFIEEGMVEKALALVAEPPVPSDKSGEQDYSGSGERLEGPVIKVSQLEIGDWPITAFRRYKNNYGVQHLMQSYAEVPFSAMVSGKNEDGEWTTEEKEISGNFILKANNAANKMLMSDPIITQEKPATLSVVSKGEYNGHAFAKINLEVQEYTVDNELFSVNF